MREVRHSDSSVNDRYTHVLEEAHLAAAEQVAALARKAANGHERHRFPPFSLLGGRRSPYQPGNTNFSADKGQWYGWGSNPRPALRMLYPHRYHGAVPPMTLIAPFAQMARSTNRSTTTAASA